MELADVLNDKEPEKPAVVEKAPSVEEERETGKARRREFQSKELDARAAGEGKVRDPITGQFKAKEEPKAEVKDEPKVEVKAEVKTEPKREEFTDKERAFLRGLEEERRKRQDLERQLSEFRAAQQKPEDKKTFWDDPEGHLKNFEQGLEQKLTKREIDTKLQTSEFIARSRYKDFDEKVEIFAGLMRETPALHAQMMAAVDPAEFVYRTASRTKMLQEAGSIDDLRAKIQKEERAKLEAEYKAKQEEADKKRADLTGSLSDVRGATTRQAPVFSGPTPLDDILGRK